MSEDRELESVATIADTLKARVPICMIADRRRLLRRLRRLRGRPEAVARTGLAKVKSHIEKSVAEATSRRSRIPLIGTGAALPIESARAEILEALVSSPCIVVCGETGSGKTTQLPQFCLAAGRGQFGTIAHTQPRRIAARSVAARIAAELHSKPGDLVGHRVRFDHTSSANTLVQVMTDGILLAELRSDPKLERYDTIIIDEAHERSINIDFLIGWLRRLIPKRPELRVIITSATIDADRFSSHFDGAPIITVPGRMHPVEIVHAACDHDLEDIDVLTTSVVEAVRQGSALADHAGDTLVFLPGEREIRACIRRLEGAFPQQTVLPLYARLSLAAQEKVLRPAPIRRIICATNVAETSLTVPSVRVVVDAGLARVGRWSAKRHVQRLPIEPVSQASTVQRAGRAGRVAPGVCVRLYTQEDRDERPAELEPEILRSDLAGVLLQMASLDLGDLGTFPFLDPPRSTSVREADRLLHDLGAMSEGRLTKIGRAMASLPVEPRVARMLLAARETGCLEAVTIIAAGMAIPDPRLRPAGNEGEADASHRSLRGEGDSDFVALLSLWQHYVSHLQESGSSATRRWCMANHLSWVRMLEWRDIHGQLRRALREPGMLAHAEHEPRASAIHRALLHGLIAQIGRRTDNGEYEGIAGRRFHIHPSSPLAREKPAWIMAGELVETTRLWAMVCAPIHPSWVTSVASHLIQRDHTNPRWDAKRGYAVASEQIMLRGLVLSKGRQVNLEPIDPTLARSVFIEHVFVEGSDDFGVESLRSSRAARRWVLNAEDRLRTRALLLSPHRRAELWEARVPQSVIGLQSLKAWLQHADAEEHNTLRIRSQELLRDADAYGYDEADFPDTIDVGCGPLDVSYAYADGEANDGLTITVPLPYVEDVDAKQADWLVPGMVPAKIEAVLRGIPKELRRCLQPLPAAIDACVEAMRGESGDFLRALSAAATEAAGAPIPVEQLACVDLPVAVLPRWQVTDGGRILGTGRDLVALRQEVAPQFEQCMRAALAGHPLRSTGHRGWDMGELPRTDVVHISGVDVITDVGLVDCGDCVDVQILPRRADAMATHGRGVRRLAILAMQGEIDAALSGYMDIGVVGLQAAMHGGAARVLADGRVLVLDGAQFDGEHVRTKEAFVAACDAAWANLDSAAADAAKLLREVWINVQGLMRCAERFDVDDPIRMEVSSAAQRMVGKAFPAFLDLAWARRIPLWLQVCERRLKLNSVADAGMARWDHVVDHAIRSTPMTTSIAQMVCLLEEYRASRHGERPAVNITPEVLAEQWKAVVRDV